MDHLFGAAPDLRGGGGGGLLAVGPDHNFRLEVVVLALVPEVLSDHKK